MLVLLAPVHVHSREVVNAHVHMHSYEGREFVDRVGVEAWDTVGWLDQVEVHKRDNTIYPLCCKEEVKHLKRGVRSV
jgi:hypothetical protein